MALDGLLLAAERGFSFADPYALGQLFVGMALLAAVVALSQQHDRPFSPAMVYLLLGSVAAAIVRDDRHVRARASRSLRIGAVARRGGGSRRSTRANRPGARERRAGRAPR